MTRRGAHSIVALLLVGPWALSCGGGGEEGATQGGDTTRAPQATPDPIDAALEVFKAARGKHWPSPSPRIAGIYQSIFARQFAHAEKLLGQEALEHPSSAQVTLLRSVVLLFTARYADARPGFERVLEDGPTFGGSDIVFHFYGTCLMRLGEGERAERAYRAMLELQPGHAETLKFLGILELERGRPKGALVWLEKALAAFKELERTTGVDMAVLRAEVRTNLGEAYLQLDQLKRARHSLQISINLNANNSKPHYVLSRVLTRQGDGEGARRAMQTYRRMTTKANPPTGGPR